MESPIESPFQSGVQPTSEVAPADFQEVAAAPEEPQVLQCEVCKKELAEEYYLLNDKPACRECCKKTIADSTGGSRIGRMTRALLFGLAGAFIGSAIYYVVLVLTDRHFAILAILVGGIVGGAVAMGARARGGWFYQTMAILLTYLAIATSYTPIIVKQLNEEEIGMPAESASVAPTDSSVAISSPAGEANTLPVEANAAMDAAAVPEPVAAPEADTLTESAAGVATSGEEIPPALRQIMIWVVAFVLSLATPFLLGVDGLKSLMFILVGLAVAWTANKKTVHKFSGPFQVGVDPVPVAPAPAS